MREIGLKKKKKKKKSLKINFKVDSTPSFSFPLIFYQIHDRKQ